nr:hypothetical protein CFP56_03732 [Quercus suber]
MVEGTAKCRHHVTCSGFGKPEPRPHEPTSPPPPPLRTHEKRSRHHLFPSSTTTVTGREARLTAEPVASGGWRRQSASLSHHISRQSALRHEEFFYHYT